MGESPSPTIASDRELHPRGRPCMRLTHLAEPQSFHQSLRRRGRDMLLLLHILDVQDCQNSDIL